MSRTTLNFHDDRRDAASALVSLREVGMNAGDVASIWEMPPAGEALLDPTVAPFAFYEMDFRGGPALQLSGWFATAAMDALAEHRSIDLPSLLSAAGIDAAEAERVRATISAGGGVTAVRARDSHLQDGD
ncbi:MAG: hypothetical protein EON86_01150 [Brevundimonas sp.]|nr:MAG: hypothetical protein EON86_01150 [Brevundimonas sp.]